MKYQKEYGDVLAFILYIPVSIYSIISFVKVLEVAEGTTGFCQIAVHGTLLNIVFSIGILIYISTLVHKYERKIKEE